MDGGAVLETLRGSGVFSWEFFSSFLDRPAALLFAAVLLELAIPIPQKCRLSALRPIFRAMASKVNRAQNTRAQSYFAGVMLAVLILGVLWLVLLLLQALTSFDRLLALAVLPFLLESSPALSCASRVCALLKKDDRAAARRALSRHVARDCQSLSAMGISKACCEYAALAPAASWLGVMVWYELAGLEGAVAMQVFAVLSRTFSPKYPECASFGLGIFRLYQGLLAAPAAVIMLCAILSLHPRRAFKKAVRGALDYPAAVSGLIAGSLGGLADLAMGGPRCYGGRMLRFPRVGGSRQPDAGAPLKILRRVLFDGTLFCTSALVISLMFF